ncbi:MAG: methyltransferase [Pseudomonadota bacterium]
MTPCCQLIQRNLDLFENENWAVVNPDDSNVFSISDSFKCGLHQDYRSYSSSLSFQTTKQCFAAQWQTTDLISDVNGFVIFMPKVKQLLPLILLNLLNITTTLTKYVVVGENAGGAKSAKSIMEEQLSNVTKIDSARRCSLFFGMSDEVGNKTPIPVIKKESITHDQTTLTVCSMPGVFGNKKVDPGTRILLEHLPTDLNPKSIRRGYDFACGSGILGAYLSILYPSLSMTYSDVSALAIYSTEQTLKENQLEGEVKPCDGFLPADKKLDIIVSNPPFHNHLQNDYNITKTFINNAHKHLNRGGAIYLVANSFLPYKECLKEVFGEFEIPYNDNKYAVYVAHKFSVSDEKTV